jgi:hypothetical protein
MTTPMGTIPQVQSHRFASSETFGQSHFAPGKRETSGTATWATSKSDRRRDQLDYMIVYAVAFAIFLLSALVQRCIPRKLRSYPCDPRGQKSLFQEVRGATRDLMPFAFMR